jgi:long-subunit acyl-CoA synthetase (AMP-forming)
MHAFRALSSSSYEWDTLQGLQRWACSEFSNRPLFGVKDKQTGDFSWITYSEFDKDVTSFSSVLLQRGIVKGDKVAIVSNNRPEWAIAAYACYRLGAVVVPLYEQQSSTDWDFIIGDCGAKMVCASTLSVRDRLKAIPDLISSPLQDGGASVGLPLVCFDDTRCSIMAQCGASTLKRVNSQRVTLFCTSVLSGGGRRASLIG